MTDTLKLGLFSVNTDVWQDPGAAARMARLAEQAGFDSLWAGEHVVLPDPQVPPSPMAPTDPILDPLISLAYLAGQTERLLLGTGIIILPQRNPLVLAKQVASLQALSGDRLLLGIGVGYLEPEFRALGIPFEDRGLRTDEYLAAMRSIWSDDQPAYHGQTVSFEGVQSYPRPAHVPIIVGGHTEHAYRRAIEHGDGWYGFFHDLPDTERAIAGLRAAAERYERPAHLGDLDISITPPEPPDRATAQHYAALGVRRLIIWPPGATTEDALARQIISIAETLLT